MRYIFSFFFFFSFLNADLVIAFDTQSLGVESKPSKKQLVDINKVKKAADLYGIKVKFKAIPWKRSLLMLEKGKIDGVLNASFKPNRAIYANYPMKNAIADDSKRLNDGNSYYIYRHKNTTLKWDGTKFLNSGVVAVMDKYAVIEDLEKHSNITIKTFTKNAMIVRELSRGKLDAYAGSARVTDNLLKKMPILSQTIVRDSLPIRKKPYYVIFSKITYEKKSKEMEKIWNGLKKLNEKK